MAEETSPGRPVVATDLCELTRLAAYHSFGVDQGATFWRFVRSLLPR